MQVYKRGTKVRFKTGGLEGYITGVCMRDGVTYAVSYFSNGGHNETWHYDFEFEIITEKVRAGFVKDNETLDSSVTLYLDEH